MENVAIPQGGNRKNEIVRFNNNNNKRRSLKVISGNYLTEVLSPQKTSC